MCAGAGSVEGPITLGVLGEGDLLQGVEMRRPCRAALLAELQGCLRLFAQKPFHDGDEPRFLQRARVLRKRRISGAQVIPGVLERQLLDARERSHQRKPQRVSERRVEVIARVDAHRMLFLFLRRASISHTGPAMPRSGTMESMMKSCVRDTGVKVVVSMSAK